MIAFRNTVIAVVVISFFTFVALFGRLPALRKTPIGFLQRLLCIHIPRGFRSLDGNITGGRLTTSLAHLTNYMLYKNNPIVLIIFLGLLTTSASIFLRSTWILLSYEQALPLPILVTLPYLFTYLCVCSRADYITASNHADRLLDYPYDHVLYRPKHLCRTCGFAKPARSKHCSLCGVCVAKTDHHCPWVMNCLGRNNYRWFLLLLLALGVLEIYGAYLAWAVISPHLRIRSSLGWFERAYWQDVGNAFVHAINVGGLSVSGVGLLAATTAPLPLGLLSYHVYLVWAGMTTNETAKWADWKDDMADGVVYKAKRSAVVARNRERRRQQRSQTPGSAPSFGSNAADSSDDDEPQVKWPKNIDQMILRTTDGKPPYAQEHMWQRATSLDDVDNLYDLGFWENLMNIMKGR
ncbi:hypothetical protein MBLNU459_g8527t1 [Dothideomycetes sp. NU459]